MASDADAALALIGQRGHGAERPRQVAGADGVGELEHGALAGVGDQIVDVVAGHHAIAGVEGELVDAQGQPRQVVAHRLGQARDGLGRQLDVAGLGLGADRRLGVARRLEDVEPSLLASGGVELETLVELARDHEQHRRGRRRLEVRDEAGELLGRADREVAHEDHAQGAHHGQGLAGVDDPGGGDLALEHVVVPRPHRRRHRGLAHRGQRPVDQHRVLRGDHVDRIELAGARRGDQSLTAAKLADTTARRWPGCLIADRADRRRHRRAATTAVLDGRRRDRRGRRSGRRAWPRIRARRRPRRIDWRRRAMVPGTVNTHNHSFQSLLRGIGDDLPFLEWRDQALYRYSPRLDAEGMAHRRAVRVRRDAAPRRHHRLRLLLSERAGQRPRVGDDRGGARLGIRIVLARCFYDWDGAPAAYRETDPAGGRELRGARARATRIATRFLTSVQPAPHSQHGATPAMIEAGAGCARDAGVPWHIHLAEEQYQVDAVARALRRAAAARGRRADRRPGDDDRGARLLVRRRRARAARRARRLASPTARARTCSSATASPTRRSRARAASGSGSAPTAAARTTASACSTRCGSAALLQKVAPHRRPGDRRRDLLRDSARAPAARRLRPAGRADRAGLPLRPRRARSRRSVAVAGPGPGKERRLRAVTSRHHRRRGRWSRSRRRRSAPDPCPSRRDPSPCPRPHPSDWRRDEGADAGDPSKGRHRRAGGRRQPRRGRARAHSRGAHLRWTVIGGVLGVACSCSSSAPSAVASASSCCCWRRGPPSS